MNLYFKAWSQFATFEGKSTRSEYWLFVLINILLSFILSIIGFSMDWTFLSVNEEMEYSIPGVIFGVLTIIPHISVSVRRIHDINLSGWWGWLFIPLAFPMVIVGFIDSAKERKKQNQSPSVLNAVANHSKDIACSIKPAVADYVDKHSNSQECNDSAVVNNSIATDNVDTIDEDAIYEEIMIEIEEDKKVKSSWAKALSQSDGDKDKAEAVYIQLRLEKIKKNHQNNKEALEKKRKKAKLDSLGGKELTKSEIEFMNKYNVSIYSPNVMVNVHSIIISTSSGEKEYIRG